MSSEQIEYGSGNVFADLEVAEADDMLAKAQLATAILDIINERGLTQREAANLLCTDQSYISKLKRGSELRRFSYDRLLNWLTKLDRRVTLTVERRAQHDARTGIQVTCN